MSAAEKLPYVIPSQTFTVSLVCERLVRRDEFQLIPIHVTGEVQPTPDGEDYTVKIVKLVTEFQTDFIRDVNDLEERELQILDDELCSAARAVGL